MDFDLDSDELRKWIFGDEVSLRRFLARRASPLSVPHSEIMNDPNQKIWARDEVLDFPTKALVNLAIMSALNRPHELETRVRGLLRGGMRPEVIAEVFLQTAFYCGNPAGVEALIILVNAVNDMRERGTLVHEPTGPLPVVAPSSLPGDPQDPPSRADV
ncbi:carboxymuconolactone decarboxylase family protein [Nocardia sp. alder85J]|uniref:carboxymuconolactone decarboxylase family protein n=1 Tax=Nocardia sp. alder85J TaxID=2862949 RepID=UPI001CD36354|nr:carboxymuconolactone decarboxylase family protein [Nocardia sp. alder85J]MCX4095644.1 carboxymuconolactone decarboxylase family protein [Nocardia sp. alder85J]